MKTIPRLLKKLEDYVPIKQPKDIGFARFLEELMECGDINTAARNADVTPAQMRLYRRNNPEAQEAFQEALSIGTEALEAEVYRRAVVGYLEPVYQNGRRVGTIRKKSDLLLMFLIKKRNPEYRDNYKPEPPTDDNSPDSESPAEIIARRLDGIANKRAAPRDPPVIDAKPTRSSRK